MTQKGYMETKTAAPCVVIRNMIRRDLPESVGIMRREFLPGASKRGFEAMVNGRSIVCQVATCEEVVIALIVYLLAQEYIRILILAVTSEWQKRGVGSLLLQTAERRAEGVPTRTRVIITVPESLLPKGSAFLWKRGYIGSGVERASSPWASWI